MTAAPHTAGSTTHALAPGGARSGAEAPSPGARPGVSHETIGAAWRRFIEERMARQGDAE